MKHKIVLLVISFVTFSVFAQDITGTWNGALSVGGMKLRLAFNITKTENGFTATMDSPDQGAKGIPMSTAVFENNTLKLTLDAAKIIYTSTAIHPDSITGNFNQMGQNFPLTLYRKAVEIVKPKRPQEPLPPYPYKSEDITFRNERDNITLAGTLTIPDKKGKFPAVVLISGSGPQDRNEELLGHKPFLVLADYLTRNGIAVLRFDDRGTHKSGGYFQKATSFDFATDVEAAVKYLRSRKEINPKKIGLLGHSEGGIIAPIVANNDKQLKFIVLLAGPSVQGSKISLNQQELIGRANGMKEDDIRITKEINEYIFGLVHTENDTAKLKQQITDYLLAKADKIPGLTIPEGSTKESIIAMQIDQLTSPWMLNFIRYNPAENLNKLKIPTLALFGEKDLQVSPQLNEAPMREAFIKANNKGEVIVIPGVNHLFQECTTGSPNEYAGIEQTISPKVMKIIANWILNTLKK